MNKLVQILNTTETQNKALTLKTTGSAVLDLFSTVGALRSRAESEIISIFEKAFAEDRELALKTLFWARDIRGGAGERRTFRAILKWLAQNHPELVILNVSNIIEYGRFDDLYSLIGTPLERYAFDLIKNQLLEDEKAKSPSLCAKWAASHNASSANTKEIASKFCKYVGWSFKFYRKLLSALREKLRIVERDISSNQWGNVNYEHVPSRAGLIYRKAFSRHDEARYGQFLNAVKTGKAKVNTKTLYPYDILRQFLTNHIVKKDERYYCTANVLTEKDVENLDILWNNLPNYLSEDKSNAIVVADTSGSMRGLPICVAVSLAIYTAERLTGVFKNCFVSFSEKPQLHILQGNTLYEKVSNLLKTYWDQNTNLAAVFDLILERALINGLTNEDLPNEIIVISDMEFDVAAPNFTNFEYIKKKYAECGYSWPSITFWNVNSVTNQSPVRMDEKGVKLVSGCSPAILKAVLSQQKISTPYELMLNVLNADRYKQVRINALV